MYPSSKEFAYLLLYHRLRDAIRQGAYPYGSRLPAKRALAEQSGVSVITESVYDTRFGYCAELNRMGACIKVDTKVAVISGVEKLHGCTVRACDLRAGAAMVIAGLAADQVTVVEDVQYIERGYENLVGKLLAIGASIRRIEVPDHRQIPAVV